MIANMTSFDNFVVYIAIVMITTIALSINLNSGRFDFSLGSMATLSSVLGAKITYSVLDGGNYSALMMFVLTLLIGMLLGLISGNFICSTSFTANYYVTWCDTYL